MLHATYAFLQVCMVRHMNPDDCGGKTLMQENQTEAVEGHARVEISAVRLLPEICSDTVMLLG